jgi:hypothetical protein
MTQRHNSFGVLSKSSLVEVKSFDFSSILCLFSSLS